MERTKLAVWVSLFAVPLIFGIVAADLAGAFSYSDAPFLAAFTLYGYCIYLQRSRSKVTFIYAMFALIWMGLSYIPTGAGQVTERIGEWFVLFFACGLIQYMKETLTDAK